MALPWKKEVKEVGQEIPQVSKQPEKLPDFGVPPVSETLEKKIEQPVVLSETVEPIQATEQIGEVISEAVIPPPTVAVPVVQPVIKDEFTKEIENILSEDLTDVFLKMNPAQQEEFRVKGEETASKIRILLSATKVNVKKILVLIGEWLKMVPGINLFFLEQEAKIKTDKILLNSEDLKKEGKL